MARAELDVFVRQNPFPRPRTQGFFYREKMRAIHRIAPDIDGARILEIGGGRSGLSALLYPDAQVVNVDIDAALGTAAANRCAHTRFVCADCTRLPFAPASFDLVTAFDLLEHVADDRRAVREALRVLRPGGAMLVTSPNEHWRFPYHRAMAPICPPDTDLMAEWGHVRRGYALHELEALFGMPCAGRATFINPLTVIAHDVAFSRLPPRVREGLCIALLPLTRLGYRHHRREGRGTETASLWRKP